MGQLGYEGIVLLLVLGAAGLLFKLSRVVGRWRERGRDEQLRRTPVSALVLEARKGVRFAGWDRIPEGAVLCSREAGSERELLDALEALWTVVVQEDSRHGRTGYGSNYFFFYDHGLAAICEALRDRLGMPPMPQ